MTRLTMTPQLVLKTKRMGDFPEIVYANTLNTLAEYSPERDRIELSDYITQFPLLWEYALLHEIDHSIIQREHGYSWRHMILDLRDRIMLVKTLEMVSQYFSFIRLHRPKSRTARVFYLFYNLFGLCLSPFLMIGLMIQTFRLIIRKIRRKTE